MKSKKKVDKKDIILFHILIFNSVEIKFVSFFLIVSLYWFWIFNSKRAWLLRKRICKS